MLVALLGRLLLLAFPKRFRDRLGRPLVQTLVADSRTPDGRLAPGRFAGGALDVIRAGLAERVISRRERRNQRSTWEAIWQDVRIAARRLNHSRGFTVVALLTLALGVGANTALFQLLQAVRLRSLPIPAPHELAELRIENFDGARGSFSIWRASATYGLFQEIGRHQQAFTSVFAWSPGGARISTDAGAPRFASLILVSGTFFDTLGVRPAIGRVLREADDVRGCTSPGVVLSHGFWQSEFGADARVIGRRIKLGPDDYEIVGVTPREFTGLEVGRRFDVAAPLCSEWLPPGSRSRLDSGTDWFLVLMGRLKPGWTLDRASAHLASISPAVFAAALPGNYPRESVDTYKAFRLGALDASNGVSQVRQNYAEPLWFLQATALLVLLVGCANLANVMLARGAAREREIAARAALGASRVQLVRTVLAESIVLSIAGSAIGAWLAHELSTGIVRFLDGRSNLLYLNLAPDWRVLAFTSCIATLTCVLSGLAAAWRAAGVSAVTLLRGAGRGLTDNRARVGMRRTLVVAQVALSLVLLTGAMLFARSLHNLTRQELGIRPDGVTIAYVDSSGMQVPVERRADFTRQMIARLESTPGVVAVGQTSVVPLSGSSSGNSVWIESNETDTVKPLRDDSNFSDVDAGYFKTIEIPLVAGRAFDAAADTPSAPLVAIVNEAFAAHFLPGGNPVGRRLWRQARPNLPETVYQIVGVVKNAKYQHLRQPLEPIVYTALSQEPKPGTFTQMVIRTTSSVLTPEAVVPALRDAFRQAGPAIVPTFQDYREMIDRSLAQDELLAALSGFFGLLAVLLATVGLYGSVSFAVSRRTTEIGLRMALGADRRGIFRMVVGEAFVLVAIGCAAGATLVRLVAPALGTMTFGLAPNDPMTLVAASAFLASVAIAASAMPARRASRLDPMMACRE
jgi:putative ABC transport system permease protein